MIGYIPGNEEMNVLIREIAGEAVNELLADATYECIKNVVDNKSNYEFTLLLSPHRPKVK